MQIGNLFSIFQAESSLYAVEESRRRGNAVGETGLGNRNTGPDTVLLSNEAQEKYLAMKNGAGPGQADEEAAHSIAASGLLGKAHQSDEKQISPDELPAFLNSESFSHDAMAYARSKVSNGSFADDDNSVSDQLMKDLDRKNSATKSESVQEPGKNDSSKAFVNGKLSSEEELAAEIQKLEEEVKELTATYEQIMSGEGSDEEKVRLSQPVHKRLQDRLTDLQNLKAQAQNLADEKDMANTA